MSERALVLPHAVSTVAITTPVFLTVLAVIGVAALVGTVLVFRRRGWVSRGVAVTTTVALLALNLAAGLNAYIDYDRTLGEALGVIPPDEVPISALLHRTAVPTAGVVASLLVPTPVSRFVARPALIYVPPAWFHRPRPKLPVLVLLHGVPGGPDSWFGPGQATAIADRWAHTHRGLDPVVVAPDINGGLDTDSECVDSPLGRVETALTVDLPRFVQATFHTLPPGRAWAVAGFSEGGSCALMLGLRHPDLFGTVGDFGGLAGPRVGDTNADTADTVAQLFGGSAAAFAAHEPSTLLTTRRFPGLGIWFEVGDADPDPFAAARALVPLAGRAGALVRSVVIPGGGHTFDVFAGALADAWPWIAARTGFGPPLPLTSRPSRPVVAEAAPPER